MNKLLIIGIDGASWPILDQAIKANVMPQLKYSKSKYQHSTLLSTNPPLTPAAWASFHTGQNPGQHGVFDFARINTKSGETEICDSATLGTTIWQELSFQNKKIALINVPLTYPPQPLNGIVVSGILTPDRDSQWTYPTKLKADIIKQFPNYLPVTLNIPTAASVHKNPEKFITWVQKSLVSRLNLALFLMDTDDFDIFMIQFQLLDWVQHALWPYLDPSAASPRPTTTQNILNDIYGTTDSAISELWAKWQTLNKFPNLLILSDHGFQKHIKKIMLGNIFYRNKLFDQRAGSKNKLNRLLTHTSFNLIDKSKFKLFGKGSWGFVHLTNSRNKNSIRHQIETICKKIIDPDTKRNVIKRVYDPHQLYVKPTSHHLPDFFIQPYQGYSINSAIDKSAPDLVTVTQGQDFHLGTHHQNGIVLSSTKLKLPKHIHQSPNFIKKIVNE